MNGANESENPYAPPAAEATASQSSPDASDLERLRAALSWRRTAFATVLSFGGWLYTLSGAGAAATGIAEGATVASPYLGVGIAALGLGFPLALLGTLLALRVRLVQFIAFPMTVVCGGMGGVSFVLVATRASAVWDLSDSAPTIAILTPVIAYLACSVATGWFFHRTVMTLARAGVPLDAKSPPRP
ncbi:MAG TPA: hypothetical protein VGN57_19675 [Pirellulaceae bacterium]|jgi:hypothetical protein|nr:hypothetical protein [Pirellulaceae bacterium]